MRGNQVFVTNYTLSTSLLLVRNHLDCPAVGLCPLAPARKPLLMSLSPIAFYIHQSFNVQPIATSLHQEIKNQKCTRPQQPEILSMVFSYIEVDERKEQGREEDSAIFWFH